MGSESYHEPVELISEPTRNMHRAIVSLIEELEAIDWYQQRAEACSDEELRAVLLHNRHEEIEHAMMTLEWIRRHSSEFSDNVAIYLNSSGPITEVEKQERAMESRGEVPSASSGGAQAGVAPVGGSLGVGSLKGRG